MTMEQKNQMVTEYINNVSVQLNNQYRGILNENQVQRAIKIFTNSNDEYETIIKKINLLAEEVIKNYIEEQKRMMELQARMQNEITPMNNQYINENNKPKRLVRTPPKPSTHSNGFANTLILSLITFLTSGIIFIIVYNILKS